MVPQSYSSWGRRIAAGMLVLCVILAAPASPREEADSASARVAGQRAHFANEFCGVSTERIAQYKTKLKAVLSEPNDFDASWDRGWHSEVSQTEQLRAMQATNPTEFAARVKSNCARLKWQAENAVRKVK